MKIRADLTTWTVLLVLLAAGCGGRSSPLWAMHNDGGGSGEFCSGAAKLSINNKPYTITQLKGRPLAMGCCDGATVTFDGRSADGEGAEVSAVIKVYGGGVLKAKDLDLANLPSNVEVYVSYQPCSPPVCSVMYQMNSQKDNFTGKASLTGTPYTDLKASLCLTAQAPGGSPNFANVTLWAGNVPIK